MNLQSHAAMPQDPAARIFGLFSLSTVLRHLKLTAFCVLCTVILGAAVGLARSPSYTTSARILIENRELQITNQQDVVLVDTYMDASRVQNQIEVLRSENLLRLLYERVRPIETAPGLRARLKAMLTLSNSPANVPDKDTLALDQLRGGLAIDRVGNSYVVDVRYTASDSAFANRVVSELVDLYLTQAAQRANEAAQVASPWLRDRLTAIGADAVVIDAPQLALRPNGPGLMRIFLLSIVLGSLAGGGAAFLREFRDQRVRTSGAASAIVGAPCLGAISRDEANQQRLGYVALRRVRMAIGNGLIGIASATHGEGAEDLARDLAELLHEEFPDTILVRISSKTDDEQSDVLNLDPDEFSPVALDARLVDLRARHSHVVVTFPPLVPGIEVEAMRDHLDHLIMVVAWGHATQDLVAEAALRAPNILRGVVLTQVNLSRLRHYSATEHRLMRLTLAQGHSDAKWPHATPLTVQRTSTATGPLMQMAGGGGSISHRSVIRSAKLKAQKQEADLT